MGDNILTLGDLIEPPVAGFWGTSSWRGEDSRVCRVVRNGDVHKDGRVLIAELPLRWFTEREVAKAEVLETDGILVSSGAYTGNVGRIGPSPDELPVVASNFVRRLRPSSRSDGGWLFHLLRSSIIQRHVWPHTGGSAIPNLGSSFYRGALVPFAPPFPEQRRIAEILDTVDEAIRKTEQVIAKLKQMKQGLLHDLLTRGIDENGELRDPIRHPEQFKDSPLGRIPMEWEVETLGPVVHKAGGRIQTGPFGSQLHAFEYVAEGVPVIMPQNLANGGVSTAGIARITEQRAESLARHRLQSGDVILARRGDLTQCAPLGSREAGWLCGTGCILVRLAKAELRAQWLADCYRHDIGQRQISAQAVGSTMVNLNTGILGSLRIPQPPTSEQDAALQVVEAMKGRIQEEERTAGELTSLKAGLMDDLLTGRVRVNVPPEAA